MHANLLWLLVGIALVGLGAWRISVSRARARAMRAAREQAMAIALAEAHKAAQDARSRPQQPAAQPPAITRTVTRPPAGAAQAPGEAPAPLTPAQVAARAEAQRIALEAARRAKAQKAALVEAERRAAADEQSRRDAEAKTVPLPRREPPAVTRTVAKPPPAPTPAAVKTPAQTLILLADDSKMVRVKTSRLLEGNAYRVVTAVDGLDAVRQLETCRPDLVITDVDMPGMDGFGLARHLRGNASTAHIPIVMITSAEDRHREEALKEGVGLVLGKPYPEDTLLEHIRSFRFTAAAAA